MRGFLHWCRSLLFAVAFSLAAYCGYVVIDSWQFQRVEQQRFSQSLKIPRKNEPSLDKDLIGRIDIPRLGVSVIVMESSTRSVLSQAAGHILGTPLPGQPGNVGISAHRDTFFRPLRNIRQNDIITLTTLGGEYRYRVVSTRIVSPHDVAVLGESAGQVLTLVTCYPFYFIGSAPNRFIVRAERIA
jgi:sortase A